MASLEDVRFTGRRPELSTDARAELLMDVFPGLREKFGHLGVFMLDPSLGDPGEQALDEVESGDIQSHDETTA